MSSWTALGVVLVTGCSLDALGTNTEPNAASGSGGTGLGAATSSSSSGASGGDGGASSSASASTAGSGGDGGAGGSGGAPPDPYCGDGVKNLDEECDGDDVTVGKMCTAACEIVDPDGCPGAPLTLSAQNSPLEVQGDTSGATSQFGFAAGASSGCGAENGSDFVYSLRVLAAGTVTAELSTSGSQASLYVYRMPSGECPAKNSTSGMLDCDGAGSNTALATVDFDVGPSETAKVGDVIHVIADRRGSGGSAFTLNLTFIPR